MKKNKITKLGTISALGLLLLVGGVYATWTYANGQATSASGTNALSLSGKTESGEKGTLSYVTENKVHWELDEKTAGSHRATLKCENNLIITFAPSSTAEQDITDYGIAAKITFTHTYENYQFADQSEAVKWIEVGNATTVAAADTKLTNVTRTSDSEISFVIPANTSTSTIWTKKDDGSFEYELTESLMKTIFVLTLNDDGESVVYLPSTTEYNSFETNAISGKTFAVSIAENA